MARTTTKTIYRKIGSKVLPAFRVVGSHGLRIRRVDVERLLVPTMSPDQASADLDAFIITTQTRKG